MRKSVRKIHLCLGLATGLVLSVVGITGSLYVFEPEISRSVTKEYHTRHEKSLFANDVAIATEIEKLTGRNIESLQWPQRGRETYVFKLFDDERWHYFDQSTGQVIEGDDLYGNSFFSFILEIHTSLTLGDTGRYITGASSLIFALLMLTTGIYLWWPRVKGRLKSSFRIKWNASKKRFNYDLHNVTGFYFFLPLFLISLTGAYVTFPEQIQRVVDVLSFSEPQPQNLWTRNAPNQAKGDKMLSVQEALTRMNQHFPDHHKRNLWMTNDKQGTLSFAYQKYKEVHSGTDRRIFLKVSPYTGAVLEEHNYLKLTRGEAITNWALPVHYGEFGGLLTRILWFIAGFLPLLLTWTGVKIWLGRGRKASSIHNSEPKSRLSRSNSPAKATS
jgi:uncharacterized iron-regulated membrane protein